MNPTRDKALESWLASEQAERLLAPIAEDRRARARKVFSEILVSGWDLAVARVARPLLAMFGKEGTCKSCHAKVWFIKHPTTGSWMIFSMAGYSHFADCPNASQHRKDSAEHKQDA